MREQATDASGPPAAAGGHTPAKRSPTPIPTDSRWTSLGACSCESATARLDDPPARHEALHPPLARSSAHPAQLLPGSVSALWRPACLSRARIRRDPRADPTPGKADPVPSSRGIPLVVLPALMRPSGASGRAAALKDAVAQMQRTETQTHIFNTLSRRSPAHAPTPQPDALLSRSLTKETHIHSGRC
jgi:hypothetical protein